MSLGSAISREFGLVVLGLIVAGLFIGATIMFIVIKIIGWII